MPALQRADLELLRPTARMREPDVEEVLKEINGCDRRRSAQLRRRLRRPEGRRLHRVRLLDLLRRLPERRRTERDEREPQRRLRPRLGLRLAARPPHPLQPRLGASRRHAVERAQEAGLVGRGRSASGPGYDVPDFTQDKRARLSAGDRTRGGDEALAGDAPFIMHPDGWAGSGCQRA